MRTIDVIGTADNSFRSKLRTSLTVIADLQWGVHDHQHFAQCGHQRLHHQHRYRRTGRAHGHQVGTDAAGSGPKKYNRDLPPGGGVGTTVQA
jgi:hypothetical protein